MTWGTQSRCAQNKFMQGPSIFRATPKNALLWMPPPCPEKWNCRSQFLSQLPQHSLNCTYMITYQRYQKHELIDNFPTVQFFIHPVQYSFISTYWPSFFCRVHQQCEREWRIQNQATSDWLCQNLCSFKPRFVHCRFSTIIIETLLLLFPLTKLQRVHYCFYASNVNFKTLETPLPFYSSQVMCNFPSIAPPFNFGLHFVGFHLSNKSIKVQNWPTLNRGRGDVPNEGLTKSLSSEQFQLFLSKIV